VGCTPWGGPSHASVCLSRQTSGCGSGSRRRPGPFRRAAAAALAATSGFTLANELPVRSFSPRCASSMETGFTTPPLPLGHAAATLTRTGSPSNGLRKPSFSGRLRLRSDRKTGPPLRCSGATPSRCNVTNLSVDSCVWIPDSTRWLSGLSAYPRCCHRRDRSAARRLRRRLVGIRDEPDADDRLPGTGADHTTEPGDPRPGVNRGQLPRRGTRRRDRFVRRTGLVQAVQADYDPSQVDSVVVLADGRDEDDPAHHIELNTLLDALRSERQSGRPVQVVTIAYGPDSDTDQRGQRRGRLPLHPIRVTSRRSGEAVGRRLCGSAC
jgi:hypothetical protein